MSEYHYNYNGGPSPGPGPGTPGPRPPRRDRDWDGVSWAIGVALIFAWFPVGLFLTIAHAAGHDILGSLLRSLFGKEQTRSGARAGGSAPKQEHKTPPKQQKTPPRQEQTAGPAQPKQQAERFTGVRRPDTGATAKIVIGGILAGFGLISALGNLASGAALSGILTGLALALGGGAMALSGVFGRRKEAKFRRCFAVSGDRGVVDIKKLARTLGVKLEEADKLFSEMVDRGYYGQKAYIDHERCLLVIDVEQMRDVYRREDEAKQTSQASDAEAKMTEYERYVERIRQADEAIEDEAMSEKIRRMQNLTASIFAEVQAHPEKRPLIDRFMTYYLPTTLKLLDAYARIEEQGVSGQNMAKAKADIERIADTLVEGYEKQLDRLYRAEAIDIAGDVSVIESMLRRDGLAGGNDFGQTTAGGH